MLHVLFNNKQACDQNYLIPDTAKHIPLGMKYGMVRANASKTFHPKGQPHFLTTRWPYQYRNSFTKNITSCHVKLLSQVFLFLISAFQFTPLKHLSFLHASFSILYHFTFSPCHFPTTFQFPSLHTSYHSAWIYWTSFLNLFIHSYLAKHSRNIFYQTTGTLETGAVNFPSQTYEALHTQLPSTKWSSLVKSRCPQRHFPIPHTHR